MITFFLRQNKVKWKRREDWIENWTIHDRRRRPSHTFHPLKVYNYWKSIRVHVLSRVGNYDCCASVWATSIALWQQAVKILCCIWLIWIDWLKTSSVHVLHSTHLLKFTPLDYDNAESLTLLSSFRFRGCMLVINKLQKVCSWFAFVHSATEHERMTNQVPHIIISSVKPKEF